MNNVQAEIDAFCEERIKWCRSATATHGSDQAIGDDVRTLSVVHGADGQRRREFRKSVQEMTTTEFEDFPWAGPRTAEWHCRDVGLCAGDAAEWRSAP